MESRFSSNTALQDKQKDEAPHGEKRRNTHADSDSVQQAPITQEPANVAADISAMTKRHKSQVNAMDVKANPSKEEVVIQAAPQVEQREVTTQPASVSLINIAQTTTHNPHKEEMSSTATWYTNEFPISTTDVGVMNVISALTAVPYKGNTNTRNEMGAALVLFRWCQYQTLQHVKLVKYQHHYQFSDITTWSKSSEPKTDVASKSHFFSYVIIDTERDGQHHLELRIGLGHHFLALDHEKVKAIFEKYKINAASLAELEIAKATNTNTQIKYPEKITLSALVSVRGCRSQILRELQLEENVCKVVSAGEISFIHQDQKILLTPLSGTFYNTDLSYKNRTEQLALYSRLRAHDFFTVFQGEDVVICNTLTEADKFKKTDRVPLSFTDYKAFKAYIAENGIVNSFEAYHRYLSYAIALRKSMHAEAMLKQLAGDPASHMQININAVSSEEKHLGVENIFSETSDEASASHKHAAEASSVVMDVASNTQQQVVPPSINPAASVALSHASMFTPATTMATDAALVTLAPIAPKSASPDGEKKVHGDDNDGSQAKVDTKTHEVVSERSRLS